MMYDDSFVQSNSKSFFQFRITALFSRFIIYSLLFILVILLLYTTTVDFKWNNQEARVLVKVSHWLLGITPIFIHSPQFSEA